MQTSIDKHIKSVDRSTENKDKDTNMSNKVPINNKPPNQNGNEQWKDKLQNMNITKLDNGNKPYK